MKFPENGAEDDLLLSFSSLQPFLRYSGSKCLTPPPLHLNLGEILPRPFYPRETQFPGKTNI